MPQVRAIALRRQTITRCLMMTAGSMLFVATAWLVQVHLASGA